jgi:hypothetical protein
MGAIALIGGTGRAGFGLGVRWALAGQRIIIGSRRIEKAEEAAARARARAGAADITGARNGDAAAAGEIIVLTIPFSAQPAILGEIRGAVLGKVVVDTTVPLRQHAPPQLETVPAGSAAAQAQMLLPDARVVAAFHTVSAERLNRFGDPLGEDVLVCGDDPDAKAAVIGLAQMLGARGLDVGDLAQAATLERLAALIIGLNQRYRRKSIGVRFTGV